MYKMRLSLDYLDYFCCSFQFYNAKASDSNYIRQNADLLII